MSSDDREPLVLTPDMLQERVRLVDVRDLTQWDSPIQGDTGAAHTFMGTFGQFNLPIVVDGEVVHGREFVQAEVTGEQFNGQLAVLDVTDLGWPREKVIAAALGLYRLPRLASEDQEHLASLLQDINKADPAWLAGTGWDGDDLDDMLAALEAPPSLDELEAKYGAFEDEDGWATVSFKAPQHVCAQWNEWCKGFEAEGEAFEALLDGRVTMPSLDDDEDGLIDEEAEPPPADL